MATVSMPTTLARESMPTPCHWGRSRHPSPRLDRRATPRRQGDGTERDRQSVEPIPSPSHPVAQGLPKPELFGQGCRAGATRSTASV